MLIMLVCVTKPAAVAAMSAALFRARLPTAGREVHDPDLRVWDGTAEAGAPACAGRRQRA